MGILTNLFGLYEGYKDFQQRQKKGELDTALERLKTTQAINPGSEISDQKLLGDLSKAGVFVPQAEGQPAQPQKPVNPIRALFGGGKPQPQYAPIKAPTTPVYALDPTGKMSNLGNVPQGAAVEKLAQPKTVEYINPETDQRVDLPYGSTPPPGFRSADIYKQDRTDDRAERTQKAIADRAAQTQQSLMERALELQSQGGKPTFGERAAMNRAIKLHPEWSGQIPAEELPGVLSQAAGEKKAATTLAEQNAFDPQTVKFYGDQILAGNPMSMGFGAAMRNAVGKYVQDKMDQLGNTPQDVATRTNVRKALASSVTNQEKQIGMMGGFVKNIDKQVDRIGKIEKDVINRVGVRALDLPIRTLNTTFLGSGNEKVLEAYTTEISNEIGKLSTGSSASIRELSTEAQERWAKIHDPNLSFTELKKILDETKHMADMRIESSRSERDETRERLEQIGRGGGSQGPGGEKGKYAKPEDVAADTSLSKDDKLKILREQFGMK